MTLDEVLDRHFRRYPLLQARDIYKLVHQGVFGPGHIIENEQQARRALAGEFEDIARRCCFQEVERSEPLDPGGELVRVNLESLRNVADAVERLLPVLVETARKVRGTPELMGRRLDEALAWCVRELPEQSGVLARMAEPPPEGGYPVLHHSRVYRTAYRPAYRVVGRRLWEEIDPGDAPGASCAPDVPPPPSDTGG